MHGERSGYFPISLGLQMLECELFGASETTLITLEGFQISLSACFIVPWMKNVLISPRIIQPAYPSSSFGATLRWDSFVHTSECTATIGVHFLFYIYGTGDDIRWCSAGLMHLATFGTMLREQPVWKPVTPSKVRLCREYSFLQCISCFLFPSISAYSILTTAFLSLHSSLDSSHPFQANRT